MAPVRHRDARAALAALSCTALALTACGTPVSLSGSPVAAPQRSGQVTAPPAAPPVTTPGTASTPVSTPASTATTPSSADVPAQGWCRAGELAISADEGVAPVAQGRVFVIRFAARRGVACSVGGALGEVAFLAQDGTPLDVGLGEAYAPETPEVAVAEGLEAVVYVTTAPAGTPGLPVAAVRFTLPVKGTKGDPVTVAWPAPFAGPTRLTGLMAPVG
ncbi:hypothetical protein AB0I60_23055 [Actinosynnema sp. NPDC050436]|uniref:hypothetical protein n=1 Tax=Actinosynnema sp. NPDC050436 TaxID=3155659 RepID=UPI0033E94E5A